jgi:hypothetical protein
MAESFCKRFYLNNPSQVLGYRFRCSSSLGSRFSEHIKGVGVIRLGLARSCTVQRLAVAPALWGYYKQPIRKLYNFEHDHVVNKVSSYSNVSSKIFDRTRDHLTSRRYSPRSACLNVVIPVGSSLRASAVDLAVTPKPCYLSAREVVIILGSHSPMVYHPFLAPPLLDVPDNPRSTFPHVP